MGEEEIKEKGNPPPNGPPCFLLFLSFLVVVFFNFVNSLSATSAFLAFIVRTVFAIFSDDRISSTWVTTTNF